MWQVSELYEQRPDRPGGPVDSDASIALPHDGLHSVDVRARGDVYTQNDRLGRHAAPFAASKHGTIRCFNASDDFLIQVLFLKKKEKNEEILRNISFWSPDGIDDARP